ERVPRTEVCLVIMREKFRLVRRKVHVYGTVLLASLARETEIERLLHRVALPSVGDHLALQHLEEQVGAATRAVLFFAGDHVARTHRAALMAPARPDAHAAERGAGKAARVRGILELGLGLRR